MRWSFSRAAAPARVALLVAVLGLAVVAVGGCSPCLELPEGARIGCESRDDCPTGSTCKELLGLCVADSADSVPPGIVAGSVSITPPAVGPGQGVSIELTVTETLGKSPTLV